MSASKLPNQICVIDDDADFAEFLTRYLEGRGLQATNFLSAEDFLQNGGIDAFDFYIIDLGLPGLDGVDLISMIRGRNQAGLLVISGRLGPDAFISALTAGADMVLNKPVRFDQVFQAIQTIMRRLQGNARTPGLRGEWRVLSDGSTLLSPSDEQIPLTPVEARLIARMREAGLAPVSRTDLTDAAGISGETAQRNLDATIFRLRRKIEQKAKAPAPLRTAHGIGYQLSETIAEIPAGGA
jgi:two-component system KDP operon response regulator KdpE